MFPSTLTLAGQAVGKCDAASQLVHETKPKPLGRSYPFLVFDFACPVVANSDDHELTVEKAGAAVDERLSHVEDSCSDVVDDDRDD
jgi:hypothetical protein